MGNMSRWIPAFAGMTLLLLSTSMAHAYTFKPEGCEFSIEFPSEPFAAKKCDPAHPDDCHTITSFTKVFGMDATVDVTVTCNKADDKHYGEYTQEVMEQTLSALGAARQLDDYQTAWREDPLYKQAILLGSGSTGKSDKIYTSQLWIGHKSVFTMEAELIGNQLKEADDMFSGIIQSIQQADQAAAEAKKKADEEKAAKKKKKKEKKEE